MILRWFHFVRIVKFRHETCLEALILSRQPMELDPPSARDDPGGSTFIVGLGGVGW